jgi:hypothetical protein
VGSSDFCLLDALDDNRELCEMTDYNNGQIHGWNGGESPVHPETVVKVWFRHGGCSGGNGYDWVHTGEDADIIAFQVVKAYVEPKVIWVNEYADGQYGAHNTKEKAERYHSRDTATRIAVKYVEAKDD